MEVMMRWQRRRRRRPGRRGCEVSGQGYSKGSLDGGGRWIRIRIQHRVGRARRLASPGVREMPSPY